MSLRPIDMGRRRGRHGSRRSGGGSLRRVLLGLGVLGLVVVAVVVRVATESAPPLRATPVLAAQVTAPGTAPTTPWPAQGQAAFVLPNMASGASPNQSPVQIASVAKVMTAYVVLQDAPLPAGQTGFTATVTAADEADYHARQAEAQSVVKVMAGETLNEQQLLEGLLIPSGNNYADILAEHDAGSIPAFTAKMQAAAKALGMTSTTYTDPSGFSGTTLSTAHDQALLAVAAMAQPSLAAVVAMPSAQLPVAGKVANFDTILGTDGFIGIKTGSDITAGGCFMFAASRTYGGASVTVFGAVVGQDVGTRVTTTLVNAAQAAARAVVDAELGAITTETVLPMGTTVAKITNAQGRSVDAVTSAPLSMLTLPGATVPLQLHLDRVGTRVGAGQLVGTVTGPGSVKTTANTSAASPRLTLAYKLEHLF